MALLGLAIVREDKGVGTLYVEYHRCEKCGAEYRLYLRSPEVVEVAFQELAKRLGNKHDELDLCFCCQSQVIAGQVMMPLDL